MKRLHPFTYVFADVAQSWFPKIQSAASSDTLDFAEMAGLEVVRELRQNLGWDDLTADNPRILAEYMTLLFASYRFWRSGQKTLQVDKALLVRAIEEPQEQFPDVPDTACYLELPSPWIWAQIDDGAPHEPLNGLFLIESAKEIGSTLLTLVGVLGLRPDRQGFSQVIATGSRDEFLEAALTMRNPVFAPVMAAGLEAGFKSIVSDGELMHLARLALASTSE